MLGAMSVRSPFPGMDPWLEAHWNGVHLTFIGDLADQLTAALPAGLYADVEEHLYVIDEGAGRPTLYRPDVAVLEPTEGGPRHEVSADDGAVAVAEPIVVILSDSPVALRHIEIRSLVAGNPLVTAIEVFSPTNKRDVRARAEYERERQAYYEAGATVVEVDLLRAGRTLIDVPLEYIDPADVQAYACGVRRGGQVGPVRVEYYPIALRRRLPRLRIPLRPGDADVVVDLQPPINHTYARGRYGTRLHYDRPPDSPLTADDAAWAADRVAAAAGRSDDL